MIYNLNCPICNTNLEDFNIIKANDKMLISHATIFCKCKSNKNYPVCSGIYIYSGIDPSIIKIELCYKNIEFIFNNTFIIRHLITGECILDLNIEYSLKKLVENSDLLDNIDYLYLMGNKIEKSMLFL